MAIKSFKSMTNGTRGMTKLANEEITTSTPEKSLLVTLKHIFTPRFSGFGVNCGVNCGIEHQLTAVRPELNFCCISFEVCSEELSAYRSSDICAVV